MDSITQLVLGATVGYAVAGKSLGRKAIGYGALVGTLPDLDIFLPYIDHSINQMTTHRGYSHAWLPMLLSSPLISSLLWWYSDHLNRTGFFWRQWTLLVFVVLMTHSLIDLFTNYGTQIALPFNNYNFALGNLFVVDPMVTLPLLIASIYAFLRPNSALQFVYKSLLAITIYCCISLSLWVMANQKARTILAQNQIYYHAFEAHVLGPSILVWRIIAIDSDNWYEASFSVLQPKQPITLATYTRNNHLRTIAHNHPDWKNLQRFNKGFYQLEQRQHKLYLMDLRFGEQSYLPFQWQLAQLKSGQWQMTVPAEQTPKVEAPDNLWKNYLQRIVRK